ncbi:MAG TPA: hypothetical protein VGB73_18180 [Pyrinomonadaceae bacterium]|jgi:protein-S-isoprenylcysteine O-methyltransferase Ste14
MTTAIAAILVVGLVGIFVLFVLVRRALRLAVRLALAVVLLLALLVGALAVWWRMGGSSDAPAGSSPRQSARPSPSRPARGR